MTAIAIGKTFNGTFGVIDSMVQIKPKIENYRDCRLQDKITAIESSNQFLFICGEGIIAEGAKLIDAWCKIKNLYLDLFKVENFKQLLISCDRYRKFSQEVMFESLTQQSVTDFYVMDKRSIREYKVKLNRQIYCIDSYQDFLNDEKS